MIEIPSEFPLPPEAFERQRSLLGMYIEAGRQPSSRPMRGRMVVAIASAILVGGLLVTPAFGIGSRLLDFIQGAPAPPDVQAYFAENDAYRERMFGFDEEAGKKLHDQFSPVIASEARGIFAIDTPDGPVYLWVAPTEDGRLCELIQTGVELPTSGVERPAGIASCDVFPGDDVLMPGVVLMGERPSVYIVRVRVHDETITQVDVEMEGGPTGSLPVVSIQTMGLTGSYALGAVPKDARMLVFVGRDAHGAEVARTLGPRGPHDEEGG